MEAYTYTSTPDRGNYVYIEKIKAALAAPEFSGKFNYIDKTGFYASVYITKVIYNDPVTIVFWADNTKTIAKCLPGDAYMPEAGLAICIAKKLIGGAKLHDIFEDWLPTQGNQVTLKDVRRKHKYSE